jgi:alpha-beta hydrolase superfamily lysophospholipase
VGVVAQEGDEGQAIDRGIAGFAVWALDLRGAGGDKQGGWDAQGVKDWSTGALEHWSTGALERLGRVQLRR